MNEIFWWMQMKLKLKKTWFFGLYVPVFSFKHQEVGKGTTMILEKMWMRKITKKIWKYKDDTK